MAKKQSITLDPTIIDVGLWEIAVLDGQILESKGSAAERRKRAAEQVATQECGADLLEILASVTDVTASDTVGALVRTLDVIREQLSQDIDERAAEILQKSAGAGREAVDALKTKRAELATQVEAIAGLLGVDVEIPKAPTSRSRTASKPTGAFQFYVIVDGVRKDMAASQNSLSSVAHYHGEKLIGEKGVGNLRAAIGADAEKLGTAWSWTAPNGNVVGLEILATDEA